MFKQLSPILSSILVVGFLLLRFVSVKSQLTEGLPQKGPYLSSVLENSIIVSWHTLSPDSSMIQYGLTLAYGEEKKETALKTAHSLTLTNLLSDTVYHYRVLFEGKQTPDYTFRTFSSSNNRFHFSVHGDTRTQADTHFAVVKKIAELSPYFGLHTGDLVANGYDQSQWEVFFSLICSTSLGQKTPIYYALGNHEYESPYYYEYFYLPKNNPESTEAYYSFDYGNSHFICLDTEIPYGPKSPQYYWLLSDLQVNYSKKFIFVFMHDHPYAAGGHNPNFGLRDTLCPIFEIYKVDLVLSGHSHFYQRNGPINKVNYIITGGGGAPLHTPQESSWTQYTEKSHHLLYFTVWSDSLKMEMLRTNGSVGDSLIYSAQNKPPLICGDANLDGIVDIGDVVYLINYIFYSGFLPLAKSDVNKDGVIDIGDVVFLINYVFYSGAEPSC